MILTMILTISFDFDDDFDDEKWCSIGIGDPWEPATDHDGKVEGFLTSNLPKAEIDDDDDDDDIGVDDGWEVNGKFGVRVPASNPNHCSNNLNFKG